MRVSASLAQVARGARAPSHTPTLDIRTIAVERFERLSAQAAAGADVADRDAAADLVTRRWASTLGATVRRISGAGLRLLVTGQRRRSALFLSDHNGR